VALSVRGAESLKANMITNAKKLIRLGTPSQIDGFSLIELLVVISILAILSALLFPVFGKSRNQARAAQCINNLRQLAIALNLYTEDAGAYPLATSNGITGAWQPALQTESPNLMFSCPVQVLPSPNFVTIFNWTGGPISPYYGYNVFGAAYQGSPPYNPGLGGDISLSTAMRTATPATRVVTPARMITIGDSPVFVDVIYGVQSQSNIPKQIYLAFPYIVSGFNIPGVGNWHEGDANLLFADAHVDVAPQSYWAAPTDASRRLWNSDNQPHEEWW
jgi:prepilin-type N-terminal cleavage/methylation domain-containing protein/prepilin-type processing-associated H-X9-DG protein